MAPATSTPRVQVQAPTPSVQEQVQGRAPTPSGQVQAEVELQQGGFAVNIYTPPKPVGNVRKAAETIDSVTADNIAIRKLRCPKVIQKVEVDDLRRKRNKERKSAQKAKRSQKQDKLRGRTSSNNSVNSGTTANSANSNNISNHVPNTVTASNIHNHLLNSVTADDNDDDNSVHSDGWSSTSDFENRLNEVADELRQDAQFHDPNAEDGTDGTN